MRQNSIVIAVDGPAASGKGTLARRLATHYGLGYLDTGSLYREVARQLLKAGAPIDDQCYASRIAASIEPGQIQTSSLHTFEISRIAPVVAAMPKVRKVLLGLQRHFADEPPGAVLDGRDIGTVVCPDATVKIFVTANIDARANRRFKELESLGIETTAEAVRIDLENRDERDRTRAISPLRQAEDAVLLDTTNLDIDAAFRAAIGLIDAAMGRAGQAG